MHLVTIAFAELPRVQGGEALPGDGTLAVFADIADETELGEPLQPDDPDRSQIALIDTAPGAHAVTLDPPPDATVLTERRRVPKARLQLRDASFGVARTRFGVDSVDEETIDDLRWKLLRPPHRAQLLGFPPVAQDDPRDDGQIALLHIGSDEFGFPFLDDGDLLFVISADDVAARRWDQVAVWPSSC